MINNIIKYKDLLTLKIKNFIVIDNFFPPEICEGLRRFAFDDFDGYQGHQNYISRDYDIEGAKYSLKQIAETYVSQRVSFLRKESYIRSWNLIMDNESEGVGPHEDPGSKFTCNIWVTPDECVIDEQKNGLILYRKKIDFNFPMKMLIRGNKLDHTILDGVKYDIVPYRCNRAIIFKSNTIHRTSGVNTKPGHQNKRVGYTFLYGY